MKKLKFKTSKGEFLVVDGEEQSYKLWGSKNFISKLSEITEQQACDIVFRIGHHSNGHLIPNAVELLHSLLKSKGIYLFENPFSDITYDPNEHDEYLYYLEGKEKAEEKTFYNPYIFKL